MNPPIKSTIQKEDFYRTAFWHMLTAGVAFLVATGIFQFTAPWLQDKEAIAQAIESNRTMVSLLRREHREDIESIKLQLQDINKNTAELVRQLAELRGEIRALRQ